MYWIKFWFLVIINLFKRPKGIPQYVGQGKSEYPSMEEMIAAPETLGCPLPKAASVRADSHAAIPARGSARTNLHAGVGGDIR